MINEIDYYAMKIEAREDTIHKMTKLCGIKGLRLRLEDVSGITGNFLGGGVYGITYKLSARDDVVIKVFNMRSSDNYADYLKWCLGRQDCNFVPKIHRVTQFGEYKVVFMEKYFHKENELLDDVKTTIGQTQLSGGGDMNFERLRKYGEDFMDFMKTLCEDFKEYNFDMHGHNIMFKKDGTPVVTDPITTKRQKSVTFGHGMDFFGKVIARIDCG